MANERHKKRLPKSAEQAQREAGALANATKGRARTFTNRKKEASRKACRKKKSWERDH